MEYLSKNDGFLFYRADIAASGQKIISIYNQIRNGSGVINVLVTPGSGASVMIEYSMSNPTDVAAGNSNVIWNNWPIGAVTSSSALKSDAFLGSLSAIRATSTGGGATIEITL